MPSSARTGRRALVLGEPVPVAGRAPDLRRRRAGPAGADRVDDLRLRRGAAGLPARPPTPGPHRLGPGPYNGAVERSVKEQPWTRTREPSGGRRCAPPTPTVS